MININELRENKLIKDIVKTILDNDNFYKSCENSIKKILADNKINEKDIPIILGLIVSIFNNSKLISIDKKDIKEVFILLFIELIEKLKLNDSIDTDNILLFLEPQIDLLLISIESNVNIGCFKKLCCCCNFSKKNNEIIKRP